MDFDRIKSEIKKIKAPEIEFRMNDQKEISIDGFMQYLTKIDIKDKRIYLISFVVYFSITALYLTWFLLSYPSIGTENRIARILIVIAFGIFSFYLRNQFIHFRHIDYDLPPVKFLQEAKDRHTLWSKKLLKLIPIYLLFDIGFCIEFSFLWKNMNQLYGILLFHLFFLGLITGSLMLARWVWKKEKAPVIRAIEELMKEFRE